MILVQEATTSTKIKSVVYEGEMVDGYRGGMGIED